MRLYVRLLRSCVRAATGIIPHSRTSLSGRVGRTPACGSCGGGSRVYQRHRHEFGWLRPLCSFAPEGYYLRANHARDAHLIKMEMVQDFRGRSDMTRLRWGELQTLQHSRLGLKCINKRPFLPQKRNIDIQTLTTLTSLNTSNALLNHNKNNHHIPNHKPNYDVQVRQKSVGRVQKCDRKSRYYRRKCYPQHHHMCIKINKQI